MAESNSSFPPDASAVFALMKSFNEQQQRHQQQQSMMPPTSVESGDSRETEELKNRLLAAAMSILGASNTSPPTWLTEPQFSFPNSKPDFGTSWEDLTSQFFSGMVIPSSEATTSPPNDSPFPNPFMMLPPGLQSTGGKCLPPFVNGNKDEDFCELCQKHFCNKYYLRKHKNDVHRIPSEPFSQIRKRETGSGESDDNDLTEKSPCASTNEWMNVLTSSAISAQQLGDNPSNQRTPLDGFRSISNTGDISVPLEKESVALWMAKSEQKSSRVELGENATFVPPVASAESTPNHNHNTVVTSKTLNSGALDMFKSSMAAAKLADRVTCELCKKELCNKYFLRTHKIKVHGLSPQEVGGPASRSSASKHNDKVPSECPNQGIESFSVPPPIPPPISFMNPMLTSQFPAPLGTLPPWISPQPQTAMPEMPKPPQEDSKKDPVLQLMAANTLVTCPLCDKTIGPRLFLPTHLTSVHSLSPTDPSFFIFILSARTLDGNTGESDSSTAKMTPTSTSDRGSPLSNHFQPPSMPLIRLPTTSAMEVMNREQNPGLSQFSVPSTINGMLPPSFSMNDLGTGNGAFDLPIMATASNTGLLLPPPLGLLSTPPGLYLGPPTMPPPPPPAPQSGMMANPAAVATSKWNPVQLAASGLTAKRVLPNGSTGMTPRKSPNQMRVLCDICNKWICNKYFLRTHKANKHGIADQTISVTTPTAQGAGGMNKGIAALPLDFSKPGKTQPQLGGSDGTSESSIPLPTMNPWSFTNPNPHSPNARSTNVLPLNNDSIDSVTINDNSTDRGRPLNLSLKQSPPSVSSSEIKHGVDQFLSKVPSSFPPKRCLKLRRRNLRLHKRAARVLAKARRKLNTVQQKSTVLTKQSAENTSTQNEIMSVETRKDSSGAWQNVCPVCKVCFNRRSQMEAHCYSADHLWVPRGNSIPANFFQTPTGVCNLPAESTPLNSTAQIASDCSIVNDSSGAWWSTRQQKWPINFAQGKLASHQTAAGNTSAAEQFCSYQASHHMIQTPLFNETTTTPTI